MWVEIINNDIVLHSVKPEHTHGATVFFQKDIPIGDGILIYDGEKLILQNYEKIEQPFTIEKLVQTELYSI